MENLMDKVKLLERENADLRRRLNLSEKERRILAGREDGCIPVGLLRPIFRRVFGEDLAAAN